VVRFFFGYLNFCTAPYTGCHYDWKVFFVGDLLITRVVGYRSEKFFLCESRAVNHGCHESQEHLEIFLGRREGFYHGCHEIHI